MTSVARRATRCVLFLIFAIAPHILFGYAKMKDDERVYSIFISITLPLTPILTWDLYRPDGSWVMNNTSFNYSNIDSKIMTNTTVPSICPPQGRRYTFWIYGDIFADEDRVFSLWSKPNISFNTIWRYSDWTTKDQNWEITGDGDKSIVKIGLPCCVKEYNGSEMTIFWSIHWVLVIILFPLCIAPTCFQNKHPDLPASNEERREFVMLNIIHGQVLRKRNGSSIPTSENISSTENISSLATNPILLEKGDLYLDYLSSATTDMEDASPSDAALHCPICCENYEHGDKIVWSKNPKCNHPFHLHCILEWLIDHDDCPMCRENYLMMLEPFEF